MIKAYTKTARACEYFSSVEVVVVDEKAVRNGHDCISLFVNLEGKRTIVITERKDNEAVPDIVPDLFNFDMTWLNRKIVF